MTPSTTGPDTAPDSADHRERGGTRTDLVWVGGATLLVAAAILAPIIVGDELRRKIVARAAPLFGDWQPHVGPGSLAAIAIAVLVVALLPGWAERMRWTTLLGTVWVAAVAWTMSLALIDGWQRGFAGRLTRPDEYVAEVPGVTDIPAMLESFAGRIVDHQPDSWTTHVSGHPPGALLTFVWLDRIGLGGGAWAGAWCVVTGASALIAVLITLRSLGAEDRARRCAPYLVLFPGLVWVGVSADGYFMAVAAWGVALLAVATSRRGPAGVAAAIASGLLLGFAIYCNYGLVLIGFVAVAVLIAARSVRPVLWAVPAALAVTAAFWLSGFWWFDGYHLVIERYYQGIASFRPFEYWVWANVAATLLALGPAAAAGVGRVAAARTLRDPVVLLVIAALLAIVSADLSALSKAETERIWLPFSLWVLVGTSLLPTEHRRVWLTAQAVLAISVNHLVLTYW